MLHKRKESDYRYQVKMEVETMKMEKLDKKPHACDACGQTFDSEDFLMIYCQLCNERIPQSLVPANNCTGDVEKEKERTENLEQYDLVRNAGTRTSEKSYQCDKCKMSFSNNTLRNAYG